MKMKSRKPKKEKKFSICLECFSRGIRFKPTTDDERVKHGREVHGYTKGMSNIGNANGVGKGRIGKHLFRPSRKDLDANGLD